MIVHVHCDGSMGFQYELGDEVVIQDPCPSGPWFNRVIGHAGKIVRFNQDRYDRSWRTRFLYVQHDPDWGPSKCAPWGVAPTIDTYAKARFLMV